jgi:signal transduction histidine kinase
MFNPTTFVQSGANNLQRRLDDFSDWMNDAIEDEDDEELIDYVEGTFSGLNKNLEAVLDGTRRIRNVLNNLRIFSREGVRTMQSCQIVEGLEATIGLVKTNFKRKINYEMSWDDDPVIIGQPSQLNQVFLNMLMNASQSIAEKMDNHADFKEGRILVQTYLHEGYLAVEFVDNGLGISEANRKKIFDPFFTTKEVGEGMGLGLSLSFGIIAEHGGRIEVDSEVGEGACFTILLPLKSTLVSNAR